VIAVDITNQNKRPQTHFEFAAFFAVTINFKKFDVEDTQK